ncbi:hypothetical protein HY772_08420 [Candidatus Woesearchaeota archaeon]|nr:hypothetical protein [Candidatus Woesearchaeota archaeon]
MNTEDHLMKGRPIVRSQRIKHPDREKDPFDEIIEIMEEYDKGCEHKPLKYNADE